MMRKMVFFFAAAVGLGFSPRSPEEEYVRVVYAKLSYAVEVEAVRRVVDIEGSRSAVLDVKDSMLSVKVSSVTVGDYGDVQGRPLSDFVSPPSELRLEVGTVTSDYSERGGPPRSVHSAVARWAAVEQASAPPEWGAPVGALLAAESPEKVFVRYATFTVSIAYEHRSQTYRAIAFFERGPQGVSSVSIVDPVVNIPALHRIGGAPLVPQGFLFGMHRRLQPLRGWLEGGSKVSCDFRDGDGLCCNTESLACGVPHERLNRVEVPAARGTRATIAAAVRPEGGQCPVCGCPSAPGGRTQQSTGTGDHSTGSHGATTQTSGSCTQQPGSRCEWQCGANTQVWPWENGATIVYAVHQTSLDSKNSSATGKPGVTCQTAGAAGVLYCAAICGFGISINLSGSGLSINSNPTAVWTFSDVFTQQCN